MSDDITIKRAFVAGLYPSQGWKEKVKKMPDRQVIAIYLREQGKPPKNDKPKERGDDDIPF
jgi:hypothetical protein